MKHKLQKLTIRCPKCGKFLTNIEFNNIIKLDWECERCKAGNKKVLTAKNYDK